MLQGTVRCCSVDEHELVQAEPGAKPMKFLAVQTSVVTASVLGFFVCIAVLYAATAQVRAAADSCCEPWVTEQTLGKKTLFSNHFGLVETHRVKSESGRVVEDWLWCDERCAVPTPHARSARSRACACSATIYVKTVPVASVWQPEPQACLYRRSCQLVHSVRVATGAAHEALAADVGFAVGRGSSLSCAAGQPSTSWCSERAMGSSSCFVRCILGMAQKPRFLFLCLRSAFLRKQAFPSLVRLEAPGPGYIPSTKYVPWGLRANKKKGGGGHRKQQNKMKGRAGGCLYCVTALLHTSGDGISAQPAQYRSGQRSHCVQCWPYSASYHESNRAILQTKYGIRGMTLAIVGGTPGGPAGPM